MTSMPSTNFGSILLKMASKSYRTGIHCSPLVEALICPKWYPRTRGSNVTGLRCCTLTFVPVFNANDSLGSEVGGTMGGRMGISGMSTSPGRVTLTGGSPAGGKVPGLLGTCRRTTGTTESSRPWNHSCGSYTLNSDGRTTSCPHAFTNALGIVQAKMPKSINLDKP
jgi:hypothetical protein